MTRTLRPLPEQKLRSNNTTGRMFVSWKTETTVRVKIKLRGLPQYVRCFAGPEPMEDAVLWRDTRLRMLGFLPPDDGA